MDTIVLKFGGSSVADNNKLEIVADKIIEFYNKQNNVVVVVSAQGKTTDNLIKEALSLSSLPDERELDVLLSSGEQMSMAKLSILLNTKGYKAISLTGWQAGIFTNNTNQDAIIKNINITRIQNELKKKKIVIIAGFQGINESLDITTLGRGGSDTTAVAIAAQLNAKHCYIFSDVDGVYSSDPKHVKNAKKLNTLSYTEMLDIASEGAKVLHNRCVEIGEKFSIPIVAMSTFKESKGTIINKDIEGNYVKSIVKNDNIIFVRAKSSSYSNKTFDDIYKKFIEYELGIKNLVNSSNQTLDISFSIDSPKLNKLINLIDTNFKELKCTYTNISKISIIGHGIMSHNNILKKTMNIIFDNHIDVLSMEINEAKIAIMFKENVSNEILEKLHENLIRV